ncbi:hypothetical protein EDD18DRAFT_1090806 [Armillaria luteobubalina]|uniref:NADP-dependent oxidoreductase domain-containing protein n=1 Tax=Armillaria luteobubalina TaxID=153913 RepID=A0AA39NZ29_9AGAR|nr:hypothetical protein EDD18DRAFT_1090806 [Armillaria luteobubalina]
MKALPDVVQSGWVRYVGMSNCRAWQYYAVANHLTPFISMQSDYNLFYREDEHEMFPTLKVRINRICESFPDDPCQYFGVGSIPWTSLARGAMVMTLDERFAMPYDDR